MKIGIVITCKDQWAYTAGALESVQTEHDTVTIVLDDGSTDETKPKLQEWHDGETRIACLNPPFYSLAGKWNAGVRMAWDRGADYVLVANNDVIFHPNMIDALVRRLDKGGVVMATGSDVSRQVLADGGEPSDILTFEPDPDAQQAEAPDFSCFMISKECWSEVGPFDERFQPAYFEDNDYHERIVRAGLKAVNLPQAPYFHYGSVTQNADPATDEEKSHRFEQTRHEFIQKWGFSPTGNAALTRKLKLLVIGDGHQPTGFAKVTHSVLERLHATGDYDIHHMAINFWGDPPDVPWRMYPAHLSSDGKPEMFGTGRVRAMYDEVKPDAVFIVQDPWHIANYLSTKCGMKGVVAYYPVDSPNLNPMWFASLASATELCTYTRFGAEESAIASARCLNSVISDVLAKRGNPEGSIRVTTIKSGPYHKYADPAFSIPLSRLHQMQDPGAFNVVPHGVDTSDFHDIDQSRARDHFRDRYDYPFGDDIFIVGYVHRNQPRKRQDAMIRAFAKFLKDVRDPDDSVMSPEEIRRAKPVVHDAVLVIHAPLHEQAGWDLPSLAEAYGIHRRVVFTKANGDRLTIEELNLLYNCFDVNCNVGGGEGWGLSHNESGACGVAQIVPDWSATGEIWKGSAMLVPVKEVRHEDGHLNTAHAVCDTDAAADALRELYENPNKRERLANKAQELSLSEEYSWDTVAEQFDEIIKRAARQKGHPHRPMEIQAGASN